MLFYTVIGLCLAGLAYGQSCTGGYTFDSACLACICQVESGCQPVGCDEDVGSLSCGYYQIKEPYYEDCGEPGSGWESCADDYTCSTQCVENYINRYYEYCTGVSSPMCCEQASRIHNGGPNGCNEDATLSYWNAVESCLESYKK